MKSFRKFFSKLDKIVRQTVIRLFKLTHFYPGLYRACLFVDGQENRYFLGYWASNLGIFRYLKLQSGYFLGFPKREFRQAEGSVTRYAIPLLVESNTVHSYRLCGSYHEHTLDSEKFFLGLYLKRFIYLYPNFQIYSIWTELWTIKNWSCQYISSALTANLNFYCTMTTLRPTP